MGFSKMRALRDPRKYAHFLSIARKISIYVYIHVYSYLFIYTYMLLKYHVGVILGFSRMSKGVPTSGQAEAPMPLGASHKKQLCSGLTQALRSAAGTSGEGTRLRLLLVGI